MSRWIHVAVNLPHCTNDLTWRMLPGVQIQAIQLRGAHVKRMIERVLVRMHAAEDHIILLFELGAQTALPRHLDLESLWMEFRLPDGATLRYPIVQVTLVNFSISFRIQQRGEIGDVLPVFIP